MSHAEACPVCKGLDGRLIDCRGCDGKGWVTVDDAAALPLVPTQTLWAPWTPSTPHWTVTYCCNTCDSA